MGSLVRLPRAFLLLAVLFAAAHAMGESLLPSNHGALVSRTVVVIPSCRMASVQIVSLAIISPDIKRTFGTDDFVIDGPLVAITIDLRAVLGAKIDTLSRGDPIEIAVRFLGTPDVTALGPGRGCNPEGISRFSATW